MYVCFTLCHEDCLLSYNLVCHTLCVQRVTGHVPSLAWAACVLAPGAEVSGRRSESQELHKSGSLWKCPSLTGKCPSGVCSLRCWPTAEEVLDDSGDAAQWGAGSQPSMRPTANSSGHKAEQELQGIVPSVKGPRARWYQHALYPEGKLRRAYTPMSRGRSQGQRGTCGPRVLRWQCPSKTVSPRE